MAKSRKSDLAPASIKLPRLHIPLYKEDARTTPLIDLLLKAMPTPQAEKEGASQQDVGHDEKLLPFDFATVTDFKNANPYHSACIDTKAQALVGLGFVTEQEKKDRDEKAKQAKLQAEMQAQPPAPPAPPGSGGVQPPQKARGVNKEDDPKAEDSQSKVEQVLDPLCEISFQSVLGPVAEDFQQVGNAYIEVVRNDSDEIVGLHHIPAGDVRVVIENEFYQGHYAIYTTSGGVTGTYRAFARFGDRNELKKRLKEVVGKQKISEIIHFKEPTSQNRWYGMPKWLSAVAGIELFQCLHQHEYDFFLNRGVPEFMLFLLGKKLAVDDWDLLMESMEANIGLGNSSKSVILNLNDREMKIELYKLAMDDSGQSGFKERVDTLALEIVTAHRVPTLLANIQIPGKLGAANEIVSAMKAFQTLVIGPQQQIFKSTMANTLGNPIKNGGLGLVVSDFEFRKITSEMEVDELDTVSRMRQDFNGPENKGRDPKKGLKD